MDEFRCFLSVTDIHCQLPKQYKQNNKTYQKYLSKMKEMASKGYVPKDSLIQYVIDGIKDEETNKILLYGAVTLK